MRNASRRKVVASVTAASSALSAVLALTAPWQPSSLTARETAVDRLALLTSEALIMSGTAMRQVTANWMDFVSANFIGPTIGDGYVDFPLGTPEQFRPITGRFSLSLNRSTQVGWSILNTAIHLLRTADRLAGAPGDPIAVFGYSQSSWIAAIEKQYLLLEQALNPGVAPISFVLLADPVRPNGGLFSRWFGLGLVRWTPILSAPTATPFPTYDIARQYDFFADFPTYPLNLLADVNAVFGLINHDYGSVTLNPADPNYDPNTVVQTYGDTTYYLIPSTLPILYPMRALGLNRAADVVEPVLKVLVELGYDRKIPYGQPTPFKLFPRIDKTALESDLQAAFAQSAQVLKSFPAEAKPLSAATSTFDVAASRPVESQPWVGKTVEIVARTLDATPSAKRSPVRTPRADQETPGGRQAGEAARRATDRSRPAGRVSPAGST